MRDYGQFCSTAQAVTTKAVSTKSYDLQAANKRVGHGGKPLIGHVKVNVAFTGAASGVRIFIVDDDNGALSSPRIIGMITSQAMTEDGIIPVTDLDGIGDHMQGVIPPGIKCQRYLGFWYDPVSEALATGNVDAWFDDVAESYEGS